MQGDMNYEELDRIAYGYVETSWLRLKSANVSPVGDCGDVQINDETTARWRRFEAIVE